MRYFIQTQGGRLYLDIEYSRTLTADNLLYLERDTCGQQCDGCGRDILEHCNYIGNLDNVSQLAVECECGHTYEIKRTVS